MFSRERHNIKMLRASLSETSGPEAGKVGGHHYCGLKVSIIN